MKAYLICSLVLSVFAGCRAPRENDSVLKDGLKDLKDGQAHVWLMVKDQPFYDSLAVFTSHFQLQPTSVTLSLSDEQTGSNVQLQAFKSDWLKEKERIFRTSSMVFPDFPDLGQLLIGRKEEKNLEGYILSRAIFNFEYLKEDYAKLSISGFVVKPQDAIIEVNEIPIEGVIIFKKPFYQLIEIEKEEISL